MYHHYPHIRRAPAWQRRNWFGTGADGDIRVTTSGALQSFDSGVTWQAIPGWNLLGNVVTVPSVEDGDMVVVNALGLTVDEGMTLTTSHRCRGLLVFCRHDCTVHGGVSMTARGCHANPEDVVATEHTPVPPSDGQGVSPDGLVFGWFARGQSTPFAPNLSGCGNTAVAAMARQQLGRGVRVEIPRVGGPGGPGGTNPGSTGGIASNGSGGGGSGTSAGTSGAGAAGTCFGGGSGSGGANTGATTEDASPYCGAGSDGQGNRGSGGGAGNPPGHGNVAENDGAPGTGGLLCIVAGHDLIIGATGRIESNGSPGGGAYISTGSGGGASGGGLVCLAYAGALINQGAIRAQGGPGGHGQTGYTGGDGGAGAVIGPLKIDR